MNHIFSLVWNAAAKQWIPAAENAGRTRPGRKNRRSRKLRLGLLGTALCMAGIAQAGPHGGQVTGGSGQVTQSGTTTTIQQSSQTLNMNWQSFNIAANETVNFVQPNSTAIAVNRILSASGSEIFGHLNANGQVWLINPNGVLFGKGSQINVAGLVASTLDVGNMASDGSSSFSGAGTGTVINRGSITAARGGYVVLLANQVSNEGVISAKLGTVAEVGGSAATLTFSGNRLLQVEVDSSTLGNLAQNHGLIVADGGAVYMTAGARNSLLASSVNNSGVISATSVQHQNGSIVLTAGEQAGTLTVGGMLDVSSRNGNGGEITATAQNVAVVAGANLNASGATGGGAIQVGGGWQGGEGIAQARNVSVADTATLNASATRAGNGGEITVRSDVNNSASTTRVHGALSAEGGPNGGNGGRIETSGNWLDISGSTENTSAVAGQSGLWLLDPQNVTIAAGGTAVAGSGTITYVPSATSTISASSIATALQNGTNVTITTGTTGGSLGDITVSSAITKASGSADVTLTLQAADSIIVNAPISNTGGTGKLNLQFNADNDNGTHDGAGVVILTQSLTTGGGYIAFGSGSTMTINGVANTLVGGDVYVGGSSAVNLSTAGGAVSFNGQLIIANTNGLNVDSITGATTGGDVLYASAVDSGDTYALVSTNLTWTAALAAAKSGVGGSTGDTYLATLTSRLENSVAGVAANYTASWLGGERLIGVGTNNIWRWVAGPEGLTNNGLGLSFFTQNGSDTTQGTGGTAIGTSFTNWNGGEPNNYNGTNLAGGSGEWVLQFVGTAGQWNDLNPTSNSLPYVRETNLAPSPLNVNAGTGAQAGTVTFSTGIGQNKPLSTLNVAGQLILLNTASTHITTTDTETINGQVELNGTPVNVLYVTAPSLTTVYGATLPTFMPTYSGFVTGDSIASLTTQATASTIGSTAHVSTAPITVSGAVDPNYLFLYNNGTLLVNPAPLTVGGTAVTTKTYDATTAATIGSGLLSGVVSGDTANLTLTQSGAFASASAGAGVAVNITDILSGSAAANYVLIEPTNVTGTINPKSLNVTNTAASGKTYDSTTLASLSGGALSGVIAGDLGTVSLTQSGTFASAGAGLGVAITANDSLTGSKAVDYTIITQPTGLSANITAASLTVTGTTVTPKTYDGTAAATLTGGALVGLIAGDSANIALAQSGAFISVNAGAGIGVTVADSLSGTAASNYVLTQPTGATGTINKAPLTVSSTTVTPKTYDGTTATTLTGGTLIGVISADSSNVALAQSGAFVSANAGVAVGVTVADSLSGTASNNYLLTLPTNLTGTINQAPLTVNGTSVTPKTYDGTTAASLAGGALIGLVAGDSANVTLTQSGTFASQNVGITIGVTAADVLTGTGASNYSLTEPGSLNGTINPAHLSLGGTETAARKPYDGTRLAALSGATLVGVVPADAGAVFLLGNFATAGAGNNILVTTTLSGAEAGNYVLNNAPTAVSADINPAPLLATATAGTTLVGANAPAPSGTFSGFVNGETLGSLTAAGYQTTWTTTANSNPKAGAYGVTGAFNDGNYAVVQAAGNASAEDFAAASTIASSSSGSQLAAVVSTGSSSTLASNGNSWNGSASRGNASNSNASSGDAPATEASPDANASSVGPSALASSAASPATTVDPASVEGNAADLGAPEQGIVTLLGGRRLVVVGGGVNANVDPTTR